MKDQTRTIHRLVDGELAVAEEQEILRQCESDNRWRELALAFVESQTLQRELQCLMEEGAASNVTSHATSNEGGRTSLAPEGVESVANSNTHSTGSIGSGQSQRTQQNLGLWSLAATVLLSLGLGYAAGWGWQQSGSNGGFITRAPQPAETDQTFRSMQFMVNQPNSQEMHQVEIPIFEAKDLGPDWQQRLQTNSWEGLVQEMRRQGLNLRQQRTLTPVRLTSGERVVVPVDYFFEQPYQ